jgi:hypothetical protein
MNLKLRLLVGLVALGLTAGFSWAVAAPNTLNGGSDYEKRLEQAGMSGMSGMSGNSGTSSGEAAPAAKKSAKKGQKKKGAQPQSAKKPAQ